MSASTIDVVALFTAATWMTLSGTALSSSIHVLMRVFVGFLAFSAVDLKILEPLTNPDADDDDEDSRCSLRLAFCWAGLLGLLIIHIVFPGLRRLCSALAVAVPLAQRQQQQVPGAWPSSRSRLAPSSPPTSPPHSTSASPASSPSPSPDPANGNDNWEADHRAKMGSLPANCFISPAELAARGKRGYTCPSYDDDDSAHGPGPKPVTKPAAKEELFLFGLGLGPRFIPSLPSTIQPAPAPAEMEEKKKDGEKEEEKKEEEEDEKEDEDKEEEVEKDEDRVPWTRDGLLDFPSEYNGIRARFFAAGAADAAVLATRDPGAQDDEAEDEVHDVVRTVDSASRRPAISGSSSLRLLSSRRYQVQPSRPLRRRLTWFTARIVVPSAPSVRAAAVPAVAVPADASLGSPPGSWSHWRRSFAPSRPRSGNRSRKWKVRRLLASPAF
ncbi:hypothetical protein SLS55_006548 [Diplodia seriata]|uniref:Uncharacterized protein n=1 Tax=Diplodia seriata TaxID=420778 RepID=A0ABR3CEJ4_9PEZI